MSFGIYHFALVQGVDAPNGHMTAQEAQRLKALHRGLMCGLADVASRLLVAPLPASITLLDELQILGVAFVIITCERRESGNGSWRGYSEPRRRAPYWEGPRPLYRSHASPKSLTCRLDAVSIRGVDRRRKASPHSLGPLGVVLSRAESYLRHWSLRAEQTTKERR